ncbi:MAG: PilC/PilY family type IV pilus protein [Nitrosomonadales bacterium]
MANIDRMNRKFLFSAWVLWLSVGASALSQAATTDLASAPLSSSSASVVRPNVLFTLDDSGSMAWDYLPDYAGGTVISGANAKHCKVSNSCGNGETPFQTNEYNGIAYNPRTTYLLPVNADGTLKANQGSPWTAVKADGYGVQSTNTINLTNGYPEVVYCNGGTCKKNGIDTNNPFLLRATVAADNPPVYAFPGILTTGNVVSSSLQDSAMNQATSASGTLYNGTLNIDTAPIALTLKSVSVSHSGSTVTVTYTATSPALATGDTVKVSGSTCSLGYLSGGASMPITTVNATKFTYISSVTNTKTSNWSNTSCSIIATKPAVNATAPSISKLGSIVTVIMSSAPTPALATNNLVTVGNGSGTCDAGYKASSVVMTKLSNTSFSYPVATGVSLASNTNCNITQIATAPPASPGISLSGATVTVYKTTHGLVTGDLIQVSNGSAGTCDSGYRTNGSVTVTKVDNNTFTYSPPIGSVTTNSNCKINKILPSTTTTYTSAGTSNSNPYYFVTIPTEYCDSPYLTNCTAATSPSSIYSYPAPIRFCKDDATAALPPGDVSAQTSGSTINCQAKYSVGTGINFQSVRYGLFWRGDIVPTTTTYGNESYSGTVIAGGVNLTYSGTTVIDRSKRSDCAAAPNCTYAEEMTNFANWYAYYSTRMQMMKSSAGHAFSALDNRYRVGFVTINESSNKYLPVAKFDATQKTNWYSKFYAVNPGSSTPLREAMAHAGRYFAGKKPGIFTDDPMEYACQQNFELITTDGYWNGTDSNVKELDGSTTMRNYDNIDSGASKRSDGAYDGAVSGASNSLSDVAMYYYKTDLRNSALGNCTGVLGGDVCNDIVPMTSKDTAAGLAGTQHMTTFSLGLADGLMTYRSDYENAITGDFSKIKSAATGCAFSGSGICNWPLPVHDSQTALDDLWHAAVNGRGTYYNARDPASLSAGLSGALSGINVRLAAAAASATSSPNITQADRSIFSSTYRTTKWDGEVTAQLINATTGIVEPTILWSAQTQLDTLIHADSSATISSRHIYTFDNSNTNGNNLKDFLYASLTAAEQAYFDNKCSFTLLSQCTSATLSSSQIANGNSGYNLVNYLRGNQSYEASDVFRARDHLLGDTVNAKPAYVKFPQYSFNDTGYNAFKSTQTALPRQGALYMGSNDGMLHAFNSDTGAEMWAYLPKIVMPNLYKLAEASYATLHQYYVDGSPETMDIYDSSLNQWRTILVGGLGFGGRGYYALDVTDPANPIALWEICSDSTLCAISDTEMGYSYGNPVITKRSTDQKWVVLLSSGYNNNASPSSAAGTLFVLDALTGTVLNKTTTGPTTNPPSGLAKLSPWIDSLATNFTARFIYGGDLNGDIWRFDLGAVGVSTTPTATKIASLKDGSGVAQSVTTRLELGDPRNNAPNTLGGTGNPVLYAATGRYLGTTDLSNLQIQSVYGIKDDLSKAGTAAYIGNPRTPNTGFSNFVQQNLNFVTATTRTTSQYSVDWSVNSGWYADFLVNDPVTNLPISPGERVNIDPQLVSGSLIVVTNVPESSACTIGGTSWLYSFNFLTGQNVSSAVDQIVGRKLPGNAITVGIVVGRLPSGTLKAWVTDASGNKTAVDPDTKGSGATRRTSWRELRTQ